MSCGLIYLTKKFVLSDFLSSDSLKTIKFAIDLQSPSVQGDYNVDISIFDTEKNSIIEKNNLELEVNSTYGVNKVWRTHPINAPITLKVFIYCVKKIPIGR